MPPKNKKKSKKPVRDPRAYATTSTPAKARARSRSLSKEHKPPAAAVDPDTLALPPSSPPAKDPVSTHVSIDLAKRQASDRIHHEQTLKSQFSTSPPTVHASARSEDHIVDLIRANTLSIAPDFTRITRVSVREWTERANFVIETARAYGFDLFDIEQALDALGGAGGLMDVLAWLCTRVPAERLPVDMRDKLEFGQLRVTVEPKVEAIGQRNVEPMVEASGQGNVEPGSAMPIFLKDVDDTNVAVVIPEPVVVSTAEPGPPAVETNELSCLIAQICDDDLGVEDAYDSDEEDPGLVCGRHYVRVSAFEELLDYLRISNQNQQHHNEITTVAELIKSEKSAISKLEEDWIYRPERAEAEFNRLWPAFHDQLLDSIRRIKDSYVAEEPQAGTDDVLDNSSDSECGLGAMFEEMLDMDCEATLDSSSSVAVLQVAPEHGWTGVPIRDLVDQVVHHYDKQAQVRYTTSKVKPRGHTSSICIVWSQPAKAARIAKHRRLLPGTEFTADMLNHCWTMPSDIAGHTSHDARDLAALVLLYTQPEIGHQAHMRLPRALREQWLKWEQAEHHKQRESVEQEHEARVELLQSLHAQYLLATEDHDTEATDTTADVPQARRPNTGHAKAFTDRAALARKRKWSATTIEMRQSNDKWKSEFGAARERLPVTQHRHTITTTFQSNQVLIVRGETGSGKSSQIPQFVLQSLLETGYTGGRVMCTQPRRISTMSIAERVSNELGDPRVGGASSMVGFQIRMNTKCADENALVFCTTGVLLRMLVDDPDLRSINCVICDEVQERTIEFDYLLIVLRRVLKRRPDLRLVLMSATIDVSLFSMYFGNCPVIDIPGRTFPVRDMFLEDVVRVSKYVLDPSSVYAAREDTRRAVTADGEQIDVSCYGDPAANAWRTVNKMRTDKVDLDLVCHLVRGMCGSTDDSWSTYCRTNVPQGAILVFLPGIYEIRRLASLLQSDSSISQSMLVVPLHSAFANDRPTGNTQTYQELAFAPAHPGVRKTVLATNVAETGITIPDVTVVIDCGMSNQMVYDSRLHISRLQTLPISRANVLQRRGRAGRVQPGLSLCLFTQHEFRKMREFELPEIQRLPLASLCLMAKAHGIRDVVQFMEQAVQPPRQSAVVHAVMQLQTAGALDDDEQLTAIGRYLCYLPVDLAIGKLLVYGATLQCLDSVLTIAAACSLTTSLLVLPYDARAKELASQAHAKFAPVNAKDSVSDHMVSLNVYQAWKQLATQPHTTRSQLIKFCTTNWLNRDAFDMLEDLRERYLTLLYEQGLVTYDQEQARTHVSRLIRPLSSRAFRAGFAQAPKTSVANDSWDIVCAAIVAAMDHTIMPAQTAGYVIGQTTVAKRVYGIGAAIQIRDRERIATRPIQLDSLSIVHKHLVANTHAIIATSLSGTSTTITAHTLSCVHLPLCVLFARTLEYWPKAQLLVVDRWIKCKCRAKTALLLITMRDKMQEILEQRIKNPSVALGEELQKWMHAVVYYLRHLQR